MAVLAGNDRGAARAADGIDGKAVVKPHASFRQPVEIGSLVDLAAVSADGVRRVIITHDVEDVQASGGLRGKRKGQTKQACREKGKQVLHGRILRQRAGRGNTKTDSWPDDESESAPNLIPLAERVAAEYAAAAT